MTDKNEGFTVKDAADAVVLRNSEKSLTRQEAINDIKKKCFEGALNTMLDTYVRKNHDYGNAFDDSLDKFGYLAAIVRMNDKMGRLSTLTDPHRYGQAKVKDETIRDTLLDLANYAVMTVIHYDAALKDEEYIKDVQARGTKNPLWVNGTLSKESFTDARLAMENTKRKFPVSTQTKDEAVKALESQDEIALGNLLNVPDNYFNISDLKRFVWYSPTVTNGITDKTKGECERLIAYGYSLGTKLIPNFKELINTRLMKNHLIFNNIIYPENFAHSENIACLSCIVKEFEIYINQKEGETNHEKN